MSTNIKIVIVNKYGRLKEYITDYKLLEKKTNTTLQHTFGFNEHNHFLNLKISIYGNKIGKPGQENKYEFPPPIDNILFFGNCFLVKNICSATNELTPTDLSIKEWKEIYDYLYGGFEDLDDDDNDDDDDDDDDDDELLKVKNNHFIKMTKEGYMVDDFIIDDDDNTDDEESV